MTTGSRIRDRGAIGILGGTFDPIHLGHLELGRVAHDELGLGVVLFVPNADPPHKQGQAITPAVHREAMVALAIADEPGFELSRIELDRAGPSYAVETVAILAEQSLAAGRPEPWFILSADVLADFDSWREPERVLSLSRIAVAPRSGSDTIDAGWVAANYPAFVGRFAFLSGPHLEVASTEVRERVAAGHRVDDLVPPAVADYIGRAGLYLDEGSGA